MAPAGAQQPVVALLGGQAVHLLSLKTRQPVGSLLGSRGATCAAFSPDGLLLHTAGGYRSPVTADVALLQLQQALLAEARLARLGAGRARCWSAAQHVRSTSGALQHEHTPFEMRCALCDIQHCAGKGGTVHT